ncbi:unnamed protein product, partial [Symbiodinium microadriaticum]
NCPCHVELILSEPLDGVEKADEEVKPKKFTRKQFAKLRLKAQIKTDCWLLSMPSSTSILILCLS